MLYQSAVSVIAVSAGLAMAGPVVAQQAQPEQQQARQADQQVSQCREDLQTLAMEMQQDGYWLAGYPRAGMMGTTQFPGDQATAPADPTATQPPIDPGLPAEDQMAAQHPHGPWGTTGWEAQPQAEMRMLYQAAVVLDRQGSEDACASVVRAMADRYQQQVQQLQELGVDPAEVTAWRQSQIAEARPATEAFTQIRVDRIIGMNVRSPDDQDFGDIGDVLINPQTGAVDYVTVTRGGFFGVGEDEVVVPWERLYVTADMASFVLPVDDATLDAAPTGATDREQVDTFWQDTAPGQTGTAD